jgi:trimeric autotransporter adhesin
MTLMNTLIQTSTERPRTDLLGKPFQSSGSALIFIALGLACFAVPPAALAAPRPSPTPTPTATPAGEDRGNNNSAAENVDALNIKTTGQYMTAHGWHALSANTTGGDNTANGSYALFSNTTGWSNVAVGAYSLQSNTTGGYNTAVGDAALYRNTTGIWNVAVGVGALVDNTSGWSNIAVGGDGLSANTTGLENTAMGAAALESNTTGSGNVAVGAGALAYRTGASYQLQGANTAVGYYALGYTGAEWGTGTGGDGNTAMGDRAMEYNVDGSFNCAFGLLALSADNGETDSSANTAIGNRAGYGLRTGIGNVYIGEHETARDPGENYHTYIHNINTTSVSGGSADTVTIDLNTGLLGHLTSSRRHKEDIKGMDNASDTLYRLKPVTYRYKKEIDRNQVLDYGLIAEEVAEVDPNLALRNGKGEIESVRYNAINVMLLNEFLKEHKAFVEEQGKVKKLEAGLAGLLATVKEQAAQIEKVSAQVQISKPAARVVANKP